MAWTAVGALADIVTHSAVGAAGFVAGLDVTLAGNNIDSSGLWCLQASCKVAGSPVSMDKVQAIEAMQTPQSCRRTASRLAPWEADQWALQAACSSGAILEAGSPSVKGTAEPLQLSPLASMPASADTAAAGGSGLAAPPNTVALGATFERVGCSPVLHRAAQMLAAAGRNSAGGTPQSSPAWGAPEQAGCSPLLLRAAALLRLQAEMVLTPGRRLSSSATDGAAAPHSTPAGSTPAADDCEALLHRAAALLGLTADAEVAAGRQDVLAAGHVGNADIAAPPNTPATGHAAAAQAASSPLLWRAAAVLATKAVQAAAQPDFGEDSAAQLAGEASAVEGAQAPCNTPAASVAVAVEQSPLLLHAAALLEAGSRGALAPHNRPAASAAVTVGHSPLLLRAAALLEAETGCGEESIIGELFEVGEGACC